MIGLDTNVLVRYIAQDDARQSPEATRCIESLTPEAPGYVSLVVIVELVWVLGSCYDLNDTEVGSVLEGLLRARELVVAESETVWKALRLFKGGSADFADCLIQCAGVDAGCDFTLTFDRGAVKNCGMRSLGG